MHKSILALAAFASLAPLGAHAQGWPTERPIHIILPLTAGSGTDTTARLVVEAIEAEAQSDDGRRQPSGRGDGDRQH